MKTNAIRFGFSRMLGCLAVAVLLVPQASHAASAASAVHAVLPKVVKIFGAGGYRNLPAYSSGFLISPEGHILTIWNHVLDTDLLTVVLDDGRRFGATLVGADPTRDVAVLKIDAEDLPHFSLDEAGRGGPGTRVLGFSNMYRVATGAEPVSVQQGVVSAVTDLSGRRGRYEVPYDGPVYFVDAITNTAGAGGGPLTDWNGTLLGMIGRELKNTETQTWINYAVPIAEIRPTVEAILSGDYRPQDPPDQTTGDPRFVPEDFGIVTVPDVVHRTPAYIDSVMEGSAAASTQLQPDDLIVFVNGVLIPSLRTLSEELGQLEPGEDLVLTVRRGSELVTVTLPVPRE